MAQDPSAVRLSTSVDLKGAIDRVLTDERRLSTRTASVFRLASAVGLMLIIFASFGASRSDVWAKAMIPVAIYVLSALGFFLIRNLQAAARLAVLFGFVDLSAVSAIQLVIDGDSSHSGTFAAFTLGVYAFIVLSSSLVLHSFNVFVTAAVASIGEAWLLREAGMPWGVVGISWIVLFGVAGISRVSIGRLSTVATSLAKTQTDREVALLRGDELAHEKEEIETKLVDSKAQNDELIQLQAAKEALAQVLVHDLRSPLTAVIASLDLMRMELEEAGLRPDLQKSAGDALRQTERLTSMISDLLDVAKLEEGRLQPKLVVFSVADLCEDVRQRAALMPRAKRLTISCEADPSLRGEADLNLLTRMVENLTTNALRYAKTRIRVSAEIDDSTLVFRVQNDGPALTPTMRAHLFEKFAQAGRTDGGWGLGLYFCKLAAEVHQGSVGVADVPDWNVTFEIRLPAAAQGSSLAA